MSGEAGCTSSRGHNNSNGLAAVLLLPTRRDRFRVNLCEALLSVYANRPAKSRAEAGNQRAADEMFEDVIVGDEEALRLASLSEAAGP
jgi:hypothetical protein